MSKNFKYLLLLIFALGNFVLYAQNRSENLPKHDKKRVRFGFALGYEQMAFQLKTNNDFLKQDTIYAINTVGGPGFQVGIFSNLKLLEKNLDLRFMPHISFGSRTLDYSMIGEEGKLITVSKPIETTSLDFPLDFRILTNRFDNVRGYLILGGMYSLDIAQKKKKKESANKGKHLVNVNKSDFLYTVGGGFEFYLTYFKLTTEARVSFGFNDILLRDNTIYTKYIKSLDSRMFQVSFIFE